MKHSVARTVTASAIWNQPKRVSQIRRKIRRVGERAAQQDIDEVLKTVEELEVQIDDLSKDDLKQKFVTLTEKVRKLEDLLKDEGII